MTATATRPASAWQRTAAAWGFHVPVLAFALRTAVAAFAALAVAHALGLEHPHWAAMSAWASSQPTREHLRARGLYRIGGSVVGVVFAVGLVLLAQNSLWVLALGLAVWVGACAFWGSLQRGYMVYGCMLAGYSAAMVVLLHHGPADTVWSFAGDRMLTVLTGVVAALAISWCFAPRRKAAVLITQSRQALAGVLQATALHLRQVPRPEHLHNQSLLSQLAQVEELLELYPEGSRTARRTATAIRWQQHQAMEVVYHLAQAARGGIAESVLHGGAQSLQLAEALDQLAQALQTQVEMASATAMLQPPPVDPVASALQQAIHGCEDWVAALPASETVPAGVNAVYVLLQEIQRGLAVERRDLGQTSAVKVEAARRAPIALHRDWIGARQAALRAGGTLLVFGVLWAWTGSSVVGFGMLGLSVMLLVFSGFESPGRTMGFVLRGQIIGAVLALLCQTLVWPWAQSSWQMVWMLLPFALIGSLVFAHKRTAAGALDTNMAMFILLAPAFPDVAGLGKHASMALAVVSGPALAWLVYRYVYPTNAQSRMKNLARMMLSEVPQLAQQMLQEGKPTALPHVPVQWQAAPLGFWQAMLHHRLLRLLRWADKNQLPERASLARWGQSMRATQTTLLQLQQWRRDTILATPALRRAERYAELALRRTARWGASGVNEAATHKLQQVWLQLSLQPALPAALAIQARQVAEFDWPQLDAARQVLV